MLNAAVVKTNFILVSRPIDDIILRDHMNLRRTSSYFSLSLPFGHQCEDKSKALCGLTVASFEVLRKYFLY